MNEVSYSNYRFDDNTIVSGSLTLANALAFDTLAPDEMTVEVLSDDTGIKKLLTNTLAWYHTKDNRGYVLYGGDIRKFTYGDPVYYHYDSTLMGKFYLTSVTRVNDKVFRLNMVSAVGLMTNIQHMGGVYSGETAGTVIDEIFNGKNLVYGTGTTGTSAGVTYTNNGDGTWTLNGTSTGTSVRIVGGSSSSFPEGMAAGGTYYLRVEGGGDGVGAQVYYYVDSSFINLVPITTEAAFTIPEDATACIVRFRVLSGTETDNQVCSIKVTANRSNIAYTVDTDVANTKMYGYLPIASARDNLQQVLFAIGASLMKDDAGDIKFSFLKSIRGTIFPQSYVFDGQKTNYRTPATQIDVTEPSYYKSSCDLEESLFDNTDGSGTADNQLVTFAEPHYDLSSTSGLTINLSGANYAYVTGTGILSGKKYTHTTKQFSVPTNVTAETNIKKVERATLISPVNSANVAARLAEYYGTTGEYTTSLVMNDTLTLRPANRVTYTDRYGDEVRGLIETMDITMSGELKADVTILTGYEPSHFGNNFTQTRVITASSGTYTFNSDRTVRVVLIGGGQGGTGGEGGGTANCSNAGTGGGGGQGGSAGKVFVTDINVTSGQSFSYTTGAGGAGGASGAADDDGAEGSLGAATTFGNLTSEDGEVPEHGYLNIMTGILYATNGEDGINGGNGGGANENGQDVVFGSTTYLGGTGCSGGGSYSGAGGGGAAYGANGNNATYRVEDNNYNRGGNGANALARSITAGRGCGGTGGNGGGGGGQGGLDRTICWSSASGAGGTGSAGNAGGRGIIILYY